MTWFNQVVRGVKICVKGAIAPFWHTLRAYWQYPGVDFGFDCVIAADCCFEGANQIYWRTSLSNVSIGYGSYISHHGMFRNVSIGRYCSIADHVQVGLPMHHLDTVTTCKEYEGPTIPSGRIKIGNDVWIGAGVLIPARREDLVIADGAVIGAGAVVTKDVPPYAIVVGSPARVVRYRFSELEIAKLLKIAWWNWDREKIEKSRSDLLDLKTFLGKNTAT